MNVIKKLLGSRSRNGNLDVSQNEKMAFDKMWNEVLDKVLHNDKDGVCCICGKEYHDYGANAMPLVDGRCCKECDSRFVIPSRIALLSLHGVHYSSLKKGMYTKDNINEFFE